MLQSRKRNGLRGGRLSATVVLRIPRHALQAGKSEGRNRSCRNNHGRLCVANEVTRCFHPAGGAESGEYRRNHKFSRKRVVMFVDRGGKLSAICVGAFVQAVAKLFTLFDL